MGGLPTGRAEEQHSSGGPGCRSPEHGASSATPREGGAVMWGDPQGRGAVRWEQSRWGGHWRRRRAGHRGVWVSFQGQQETGRRLSVVSEGNQLCLQGCLDAVRGGRWR